MTGLLYALKRFSVTALGGAVFNLGIVIAAPLLAGRIGIYALPLGVLVGSLFQLAVLTPGLRGRAAAAVCGLESPGRAAHPAPLRADRAGSDRHPVPDHRGWPLGVGHRPAERELDALRHDVDPVAAGTGAGGGFAGRAAQPLATRGDLDWDGFRGLFARGLRLVIVLLLPATVGLWVLAVPVIRLLFQHGSFTAADTLMTAIALRFYLIGLPFAGVDFLLNYTFYARQDTRTPAVVGVIAVGIYFVVALLLKGPLGFLGLVLADSAKQAGHALIMTFLLLQTVGRPTGQGIRAVTVKTVGAAAAMGLVTWFIAAALARLLPPGLISEVLMVAVPATVGAIAYLALLKRSGVAEAMSISEAVTRRILRLR